MSSTHVDYMELNDLGPTVLRAMRGLRYGSLEIVVHDGRIVQIERHERLRLDPAGRRSPDGRERTHDSNDRAHRTSDGSRPDIAGETTR